MVEKIYTIPVNEAFDACAANPAEGCPFCKLRHMLEENELDLILGASMMEPDVRIKTNEQGFCKRHYDMMFTRKNRLGLALILESHLDELRGQLDKGGIQAMLKGGSAYIALDRLERLDKSCYVCGRIDYSFGKMLSNSVLLWDGEAEFRAKTKEQPYFCLPHYKMWLEAGKAGIAKKRYEEFYADLSEVVFTYFDKLRGDVSWFVKKFDYRFDAEPWGDSKDAVERAIKFVRGC